MGLLELLGIVGKKKITGYSTKDETEAVKQIASKLEDLDPERARYIACFSYLLARVARADMDISARETKAMERLLQTEAALSEHEAVLVVEITSKRAELFGGTDDFLVTREFNKIAGREQKLMLLRCLFAVAAADENISSEEDSEIRQIASELKLDHRDFIAARVGFKSDLGVLKRP